MSVSTNDGSDVLPPGLRSNLVLTIHNDNPDELLTHLEACNQIEYSALLSEQGGKAAPTRSVAPWNFQQVRQSPIRRIDNILCGHLSSIDDKNDNYEYINLHTLVFGMATRLGKVGIVSLLLSDKYRNDVNPSYNFNYPIHMASFNGHIEIVKLLLNDTRVDPSAEDNQASRWALVNNHVEVTRLLLEDKRVDLSTTPITIQLALQHANPDTLRLLLADERIVVTNELLGSVDDHKSSARVDALFEAAHPRIWPRVIGNEIDCVQRQRGHLRNKLDGLEVDSSWVLLLCVKHICTKQVAARIGDVLREVCSEWTRYRSQEVETSLDD